MNRRESDSKNDEIICFNEEMVKKEPHSKYVI